MPPDDQTSVNWNRAESISVPAPDREGRLAVRRADWDRIKRSLANCTRKPSLLPVWYSILFGVSGSAGLTIVPLLVTKDLPAWVLPAYIIATLASGLMAWILVRLDKERETTSGSEIALIQSDMKDVESAFQVSNPPTPPIPQAPIVAAAPAPAAAAPPQATV